MLKRSRNHRTKMTIHLLLHRLFQVQHVYFDFSTPLPYLAVMVKSKDKFISKISRNETWCVWTLLYFITLYKRDIEISRRNIFAGDWTVLHGLPNKNNCLCIEHFLTNLVNRPLYVEHHQKLKKACVISCV